MSASPPPPKRRAVADEELEKENGKLKTVNAELIVENVELKAEIARLRALLGLPPERLYDAPDDVSRTLIESTVIRDFEEDDASIIVKPLKLYTCAVCNLEVRSRGEGSNSERFAHIAMHEKFRIPCPIVDCRKDFLLSNLYHHLESIHEKQTKSLTPDERQRHKANLGQLNAKAWHRMTNYFPEEGSLLMVTRPKQLSSVYCKICGLNPTNRSSHVAAHAGLTLQCPIDGCEAVMNPSTVGNHLRHVHSLSEATMSVAQRARFKSTFAEWQVQVDKMFDVYFS